LHDEPPLKRFQFTYYSISPLDPAQSLNKESVTTSYSPGFTALDEVGQMIALPYLNWWAIYTHSVCM
jgi:hypothetical protein